MPVRTGFLSVTLFLLLLFGLHAEVPAGSPLRRKPELVNPPAGWLVRARLLATPAVPTLLGYTRQVLHLSDGHTLAFFSYSGSAKANWLFLLDSRDLTCRRFDIPNNDIASHGGALGRDGNIYIMPYATGRAYRFRVSTGQFEPLAGEPLAAQLAAGELTWEAFGASDGSIYFGTYPNAYLGRYNPATSVWTLHKQVAPNTKYVIGFREDPAGRIHCKAWGPDVAWMTFDPGTGQLTRDSTSPPAAAAEPPPAVPKGDMSIAASVAAEGRRFVVTFPTSRIWEIEANGGLRFRGDPAQPAESWFLESVPGAVIGIGHLGMAFRFDLRTGGFRHRRLPTMAPGGNPLMFLEAVTPRAVVGANYSQQNLFKVDPETGKVEMSLTRIARVTGEPMCATHFGGKAYLGLYTHSLLAVYDPARPLSFPQNPLEIADLGTRYHQTRPRDATTGNGLVFISSDSDYNYLGGALAVISPQTGNVDVYHHLIADQNLPTLAFDQVTGLLWGGTDRWGQMRSHPPTQASSILYAFDPRSRRVVEKLTPWPGADVTSVLGISAEGVLVAASGGEIALIDTATRQILYRGASPIGVPPKLRLASDGASYCLAKGMLYRWDLRKNLLTPVAEAPGCSMLTEASPGIWLLGDRTSVYRVKPGGAK